MRPQQVVIFAAGAAKVTGHRSPLHKYSDNEKVRDVVRLIKMWQRHAVRNQLWKNSTDRLVQCRVVSNLRFVKIQMNKPCL